jgi:uncharacterized protein YjbI with pentapeptide repeats
MHKLASDAIATLAEQTCKAEMRNYGPRFSGNPCGRPIYSAPEYDVQPVCIMHSKDPNKSGEEFQREFERILDEAEKTETEANFTGFIFVNSDFHGRAFNSACSFFRVEFSNQSNFIQATFNGDADFTLAKFAHAVSFTGAKFERHASFYGTKFGCDASFGLAKFAEDANFAASKFKQEATFVDCVFFQSASFREAIFGQRAEFGGAQFSQTADFNAAMFTQDANFRDVSFVGDARFSRAVFSQETLFRTARFSGAAVFRDTRFRHDLSTKPGLDFTDVKIEHPEKVEFYRTDLGQALFHNTDLSKVDFTLVQWRDRGRVQHYRWRRRWYCLRRFGAIRGRKVWLKRWELLSRLVRPRVYRLCLFDEDVALAGIPALRLPERQLAKHCLSDHLASTYRQVKQDYDVAADFRTTNDWRQLNTRMRRFYGRFGWAWAKLAWALRSPNMMSKRNYSLIAETYQQLKRNYDAKGDYWTAGHWHYGEMEMKRLHSRWSWRPLRWLDQHFSLVALYKYASAYGESYIIPLLWLVFFLAAFAFLYPVPGIEFNPPPGNISAWLGYVDWTTFFHTHPAEHPSGFWGMILHSLMTSISVAGFQRELRYVPSYPWGRMLALFELVLTTTLGGLFLLAIRRQFKRS